MLPRVRWPVLIVFLVLTAAAAYVALARHPPPPFARLSERPWLLNIARDHWLHFGYCFLATVLLTAVLRDPSPPLSLVMGVMLLVSVGSEMIQGVLPWKRFDWYDVLANMVGSVLGGAVILLTKLLRRQRLPSGGKEPSGVPDSYELLPV